MLRPDEKSGVRQRPGTPGQLVGSLDEKVIHGFPVAQAGFLFFQVVAEARPTTWRQRNEIKADDCACSVVFSAWLQCHTRIVSRRLRVTPF